MLCLKPLSATPYSNDVGFRGGINFLRRNAGRPLAARRIISRNAASPEKEEPPQEEETAAQRERKLLFSLLVR
jgi:hypothetical protein